MGNLRRYYYANKTKIWKGVLIVAFILVIIQVLNYFAGRKNTNKTNTVSNNISTNITENTSLTTNKSSLGTGTVSESKLKNDMKIIDEFLNLCNNKKFEDAYKLVSTDCKNNLFTTYEIFKKTYCDKIFNTYKTYTTENWNGNTYKVRITEDPLATGKTSNDMSIQDYMTIVEENNEEKLNINNYIWRNKINAVNTKSNVKIEVISRDTFAEYEVYNIRVTNNSDKTLYLDDGEKTSTIYIEDSKGLKYNAASGEIIYSTLKIRPGSTVEYAIKYTNTYRASRKIKKLVFANLILDYDKYIKNPNNYNEGIKYEVTF